VRETLQLIVGVIAVVAIIAVVAYFSFGVVRVVVHRFTRNLPLVREAFDRCRNPVRLLVGVILAEIALRSLADSDDDWYSAVDHAISIAATLAFTWLAGAIITAVAEVVLQQQVAEVGSDEVAGRRARTQIILLRRLIVAAIVTFGVAAVLMSFPAVRTLGTGLLASAGLISIVAGLAAQTSLTNLFAGIQLALTDALRVGDVVVVENESGYVDTITLTYVVVKLWDGRNLILPSSYFISQPFENWTRNRAQIGGSVELDVGWSAPVAEMRQELDRLLDASPVWDGRTKRLVVSDATGGTKRIRIDLSAGNTNDLFILRNAVREGMIDFLVRTHPDSLLIVQEFRTAPSAEAVSSRAAPSASSGAAPGLDGDG
jgi:small-conductance mechanosensitive channel